MADWTIGTTAQTHLDEHNLFDHDGIATPTAGKVLGTSGGVYTQIDAPATSDTNAFHDDESAEISALTEKGTPASTDVIVIEDSAASYAKKKVQIGNLPAGEGGGTGLTGFLLNAATSWPYTIAESGIYIVDSSAANRTVILPAVSSVSSAGMRVVVKRLGSNYVYLTTTGSDHFDLSGVDQKTLWVDDSAITVFAMSTVAATWMEFGQFGNVVGE